MRHLNKIISCNARLDKCFIAKLMYYKYMLLNMYAKLIE